MCCVVLLLLLIIIFYKVHINPQFGSVNFISEQHLIPGNRVTFANGRFHIHTQHTHIQGFLWDSQQLDGVPSSLVTFTYSLNGCCLLCVAYCRVYAICFAVFLLLLCGIESTGTLCYGRTHDKCISNPLWLKTSVFRFAPSLYPVSSLDTSIYSGFFFSFNNCTYG